MMRAQVAANFAIYAALRRTGAAMRKAFGVTAGTGNAPKVIA